ncbi:hypothetical protein, partial [Streptomyces buecherae]
MKKVAYACGDMQWPTIVEHTTTFRLFCSSAGAGARARVHLSSGFFEFLRVPSSFYGAMGRA